MGKEQSLEEMVLRKPDTCVQTNGVRPLLLFSCSVRSDSLWPHGLQHARLPCPSPSPGACSNSCPLSQWCDPMDYTAHGILQARILEWVPFPPPGDLPSPEIKPRSPALQADSLPAELPGKPVIQISNVKFPNFKIVKLKVVQSLPTLCNPLDYSPWSSPGQNTGVGSLSLFQNFKITTIN